MSDPVSIAAVIAKRFDCSNATFDRRPQFDIMNAAGSDYGTFDFIVASEVFEHVSPPLQTASDNLVRLLKAGGFAVFSTPWELTARQHPGDGSVFEERTVTKCETAGFAGTEFAPDYQPFGIVWDKRSRGLTLRRD